MRLALTLLAVAGLPVSAATLSDSTFLDSAWTTTLLYNTVGGSTASGFQQSAAGNDYRVVHHSYNGAIIAGHIGSLLSWDPAAQGGIASIDVSYRYRKIESSWAPGQIATSVLLLQGGAYYYAVATDFAFGNFDSLTRNNTGLTAASFSRNYVGPLPGPAEAPAQPDFSASGAPIAFGYYTANSTTFSMTTTSAYDDFVVTVHQQVPEPSALLLSATGLTALVLRRRRQGPVEPRR